MKFLKGLGYLLLLLSAALMLLVFACAWKPGLTEEIAAFLYPESVSVSGRGDADERPTGNENAADNELTGDVTSPEGNVTGVSHGDGDVSTTGDFQPERADRYIAPDREKLSVPEEVNGKSGYQPTVENDSEIEDEEAVSLEKRLGVGETGDGLVFDALYYPYYDMLDEQGQHLYRQIYANAKARNQTFAPIEPVKAGKLRDIFSAVYNDHPELFWLDTAYACKHKRNGECVEISLQFNRTAKNLERENAAFESAAQEIISVASGLSNDYDKERYVHDMLVQKVEYSKSAEMNQSAYSALVNGRTVCAGYARAFQYLMQQLQVPCYYCTGYAGEDHAWNIIRLEDGYYNVDVTWDDTEDGICNYFNKTDADYANTHVRQELSVNLPPCNGQMYRSEDIADAGEEAGLRTSSEAGFLEAELLHSMEEYYADCDAQIVQHGKGDFSFSNVLEGNALYEEWEQAYNNNEYKEGYMVAAMRKIGAKSCHIQLTVEKLQQGRYLITHELQLH